jgi:hypothetical protein
VGLCCGNHLAHPIAAPCRPKILFPPTLPLWNRQHFLMPPLPEINLVKHLNPFPKINPSKIQAANQTDGHIGLI